MRKAQYLLFGVFAALSTTAIDARQAAVDTLWTTDVWVGFTHARDRGVPMLIALADVDGCQPCASLQRDIKNNPEILALRKTMELIWLNPAADDVNKNVAKVLNSLNIEGYPTTVLLDLSVENGVVQALVERGRVTGYFPRDEFITRLRAIVNMPMAKPTGPSSAKPSFESAPKPGAAQLPRTVPGGTRTPNGQVMPRKQ